MGHGADRLHAHDSGNHEKTPGEYAEDARGTVGKRGHVGGDAIDANHRHHE